MKQRASTARSARVAVRLTREDQHQVEETARARGYANASAFIRAAIRNELDGRAELTGTDERMGAGFDRVSRDIFRVEVIDLGDAEILLNTHRHLGETARQLLKRGVMPTEDGWGGWLGRYQSALCKTTREIEERKEQDWVRKQERRRDHSRGR